MIISIDNDILANLGGIHSNSLTELVEIDETNNDIEEPSLVKHSPYFDHDMLTNMIPEKNDILKCLSLNIQSINAKIDQLRIYLEQLRLVNCKFDAICVQETWLGDDSSDSHLQIEGYTLINQPYQLSSHNGLAIYLSNNLQYANININRSATNSWEGQFIKIKISQNQNITLGNIYRPPRESIEYYQNFMNEFIATTNTISGELIIAGDYNIDLLKVNESPMVNDYFELIMSNGLVPKITLPTRISRTRGTLIDNFLCRLSRNFSESTSGIITYQLSDHQPYFICLDYLKINNQKNDKYIKIVKPTIQSILKIKEYLNNANISSKLSLEKNVDPNVNYEIINNTLQTAMNTYIHTKFVKFNKHKHKNSRWITTGIIRSIRFRDKFYLKLKKTPSESTQYELLKTNFQTYNKLLKKTIRAAKIEYYDSQLKKFQNDAKKTWSIIKNIINKSTEASHSPTSVNLDGTIITNMTTIVNEFNKYYVNVGPDLASKISMPPNKNFKQYLSNPVNHTLTFNDVTESDIMEIINNLKPKTSQGFDNISTILLQNLKNELCSPLTIVINQMIKTGQFPDILKIAKVTPIYKKDDPTLISNFRPISVLSSISKVFEKVIFKQIHHYFKINNLYYSGQYGFREMHSTQLAVVELIDRIITDMDSGKVPLNIFIDLSKAFDTIDHDILLHKLHHYGIRNSELKILQSYLSNRKQYVSINNMKSHELLITTGVPQGSILGPLLFIIYINDLCQSTNILKTISYADDTTLFIALNSKDFQLQNDMINNELKLVSEWLDLNKLSLNISKTKFMIFHCQNNNIPLPKLQIKEEQIENVSHFNLLGIELDTNLKWKIHTNKISKKVSKATGIIGRLKNYLPKKTLRILYFALINTHFDYGLLCWGHTSKMLTKLQKKAIRIVTKSKFNAHTEPLFRELQILKITDLYKLKLYKFYYKIINDQAPVYFTRTFLTIQQTRHSHLLRNQSFLKPRIFHSYAENCTRHQLPTLLNASDKNILEKVYTHSEKGFASYIKNIFINDYHNICSNQNCYICNS